MEFLVLAKIGLPKVLFIYLIFFVKPDSRTKLTVIFSKKILTLSTRYLIDSLLSSINIRMDVIQFIDYCDCEVYVCMHSFITQFRKNYVKRTTQLINRMKIISQKLTSFDRVIYIHLRQRKQKHHKQEVRTVQLTIQSKLPFRTYHSIFLPGTALSIFSDKYR